MSDGPIAVLDTDLCEHRREVRCGIHGGLCGFDPPDNCPRMAEIPPGRTSLTIHRKRVVMNGARWTADEAEHEAARLLIAAQKVRQK
jgi:hypothetical protein